ncbi:wax ester/triacylglycerol synthase family O-acyltransferase [Gordonia amarae]|uniref:wax ester/triacylglycerol synthase family O-acyltransferase n=1 Tax=Gordonia amarae TaxID=36821 RepID=UPI001AF8173B|nr:wax ester/triacylglycerol synthase family O-acyltransferase [Gordonia amarae]QHN18569.1 wax ester/triacylglycerol synthase family O-acyltransferase [Gordonia amarae]QHN23052.1 wax ester/triacylglycerol synthase family O-acyltransferase [Gordonia amarae]
MVRLSPRDATFYFLDDAGSTTHLGALLIIAPDAPGVAKDGTATGKAAQAKRRPQRSILDYKSLVELVENRLQLVPRYRQLVLPVTLGLARPVWADDPDFDINFHIRRAGLPAPGGPAQLDDLVARIMSRPLDRTRPLWEMYLIEGLAGDKLAVLTKSHRCLVDEDSHREISEVLTDETREQEKMPEDLWMARSLPSGSRLALGAIAEAVARPGDLVSSVLTGNGLIAEVRTLAERTVRRTGSLVQQVMDSAPASPLNRSSTSTRSFAEASVPRRGCAKIAERYNCTVNDVVLSIISGVLRRWRLSLEATISPGDTVRVVLPLSSRDPSVQLRMDAEPRTVAVGTPGFVTDLPVGEDNPSMRLVQVAGLANRYAHSSRRVSMGIRPILPELGMVPFPEFSSRALSSITSRPYNVPVTMPSAPISRRYIAGQKVSEMYAVLAFMQQHALAIGVIEYCGALQFSFIADRGVLPDLGAMAEYVTESYEELVAAL